MWKKTVLIFVIALSLIVAGCSSGNDNNNNNNELNNNETNVNDTNNNNSNNDSNNDDNNNNDDSNNNDNNANEIEANNIKTSVDGTVTLAFSDEWNDDFDLNASAIIAASNRQLEKYTLVVPTLKSSLGQGITLDEFHSMISANMETAVINYDETDAEKLTIDGLDAVQYEVSGLVQGVKIVYLITLVETDHRFYQVSSWSLPSSYDDYEAEYKQIANSFTLDADAEQAMIDELIAEESEVKTYVSPAGDIQFEVPGSWNEDSTVYNDQAEFILSSRDMAKYLMVTRVLKSDLDDSVTLADYQQMLEEVTPSTGLQNYESTTPVELEINGHDALQYEVIGSIENVQLHYLYTLVETDEYYNQIMLWSDQANFPSLKESFQEISATFQADR